MKPNEKQKKICSLIGVHASYWNNTNDINSPTHGGDLAEDIRHLEDFDTYSPGELTEDEQKELEILMNNLLNFIRKVK